MSRGQKVTGEPLPVIINHFRLFSLPALFLSYLYLLMIMKYPLMKRTPFVVLLLLITGVFCFGQTERKYDLHLSTGTVTLAANFDKAKSEQPAKSEFFRGSYYRYIQFVDLPSTEQKEALAANGVKILMYLPDNTYIAAVKKGTNFNTLVCPPIRGLHVIKPQYKMLNELREALEGNNFPSYTVKGNKIGIGFTYYENLTHEQVRSYLRSKGYEISDEDIMARWFVIWVKKTRILSFVSLPFVSSAELVDDEPKPDNIEGRTDIRSNAISTDYSGGRKFNGLGVNVALQDDGLIGPHIDYQGRIPNQFMTNNSGDHGDHCGGIIMAAGNKDPLMRGMAWGANIHVYNASNYQAFSQIGTDYNTLGIRIISTSYSDGCNAGYTTRAQQLDIQNLAMPELIHVFSAGNNGTSNCSYGAGSGWGNVTGGHKHSKNSIAVANLTYLDVRNTSSSRGPAHDGRLKPEVSAVGTNVFSTVDTNKYVSKTGTSMSCPAVAGLFAQLYHAYKSLNSNNNPPSALIKAVVMNTADDLGNPGPDYSYGYGRVNGLQAVKVIEQGAYLTATVSNAGSNSHIIAVPSGVKRIKVMTYWHDYQAQIGAAVALVNNLNTTITDPFSTVSNPLVLNFSANATSLNSNAAPGTDIRNNHEQITINNPATGNYVLNVSGASVPMGPQPYFVTWLFEMDGYTVIYPIGGEGFSPNITETVRWDALETSGNQTLEYTTNNGSTWNLVSSVIPGAQRYYSWSPPAVISGQCRIRISRGAYSAESDTNFTIISPPSNIQVAWVCPDSVKLTWNAVAGATSYDVFRLGSTYMDSIATSLTNFCVVTNVPAGQSHWFSVRSRGPLSAVGRRAIAIEKKPGLYQCPQLANDLACDKVLSPEGTVNDCHDLSKVPVIVNLYNPGINPLSGINAYYRINGGPVVSEPFTGTIAPAANVTFTFATTASFNGTGTYNIKAWAKNASDPHALNDTSTSKLVVVAGVIKALPISEDFETFTLCSTANYCPTTCNLSNGFINESNTLSDKLDWRTNSGAPPTPGTGPQADFYPGTPGGKYIYLESTSPCSTLTAKMLSPCIDLSTASNATLTFAYHMYGASMGTLYLDIFANGAWTNSIWSMTGDQGNSWKIASVNLSPWGSDTVSFRWRGTAAGGLSDMALDAINIVIPSTTTGTREFLKIQKFRVFPNPGTDEFNVVIPANSNSELGYTVTDISGRVIVSGKAVTKSGETLVKINLRAFAAGIYTLRLTCDGRVEHTKLYKI
jgi:hypothetical protein